MITKYKLFEYVKNKSLAESTLDHVIKRLEKIFAKMGYKSRIPSENVGSDYIRKNLEISTDKNKIENGKKIKNFLDKYLTSFIHNILITTSMILSYDTYMDSDNVFLIKLYIKNLKIKRVIPDRYIYHVSPIKNRESIKKNGLLLKSTKDSPEWSVFTKLYYPPAVFAMNKLDTGSGDFWHESELINRDVWRIDTKGLSNIWWVDSNLYFSEKYPTDAVMTFESIPPKALKRIVTHEKLPKDYEITNRAYARLKN